MAEENQIDLYNEAVTLVNVNRTLYEKDPLLKIKEAFDLYQRKTPFTLEEKISYRRSLAFCFFYATGFAMGGIVAGLVNGYRWDAYFATTGLIARWVYSELPISPQIESNCTNAFNEQITNGVIKKEKVDAFLDQLISLDSYRGFTIGTTTGSLFVGWVTFIYLQFPNQINAVIQKT